MAVTPSSAGPNTVLFISSGSSEERAYLMEQAFETAWKVRDPDASIINFRFPAISFPIGEAGYERAAGTLSEWLRGKKLAIVVAQGDPAIDLAVRFRDEYFARVPVLGCEAYNIRSLRLQDEGGVFLYGGQNFAEELLKLGFALYPKARRAYLIVSVGPAVDSYRSYVEALQAKYPGREIVPVLNPDQASVDAALGSSSSKGFAALLAPGWTGADGKPLLGKNLIRAIEEGYGVPVLSFIKEYLGGGLVGGVGVSAQDLGKAAAGTGLALVLDGRAPPASIPTENLASTFVDYGALLRFGSSPAFVPRGAEVTNRPPSLWIRYRGLIMTAIAVLLASTLLLLLLLEARRRERNLLVRTNGTLERKVEERTGELRSANEELYASNENLKRMIRRTEAMQETVLRHEREVTLGRLTMSIAHELNTPLGAISSANEAIRAVLALEGGGVAEVLASLEGDRLELVRRYAGRALEGALRPQLDAVSAGSIAALEARLAALSCADPAAIAADLADACLDDLGEEELRLFAAKDAGAAANALCHLALVGRSTSITAAAVAQAVEVLRTVREYLSEYKADGARVELRHSIESALFLFKNRLPHGTEVKTDFSDEPSVMANEAVLVRVWVHLIQNALEAMPDGGVLAISVRRKGSLAAVSFDDEGTGVAPSIAANLFSPFATTKPPAEGLGLGLAYCRKAIEALSGSVAFAAKAKGSVFTVLVPAEEVP